MRSRRPPTNSPDKVETGTKLPISRGYKFTDPANLTPPPSKDMSVYRQRDTKTSTLEMSVTVLDDDDDGDEELASASTTAASDAPSVSEQGNVESQKEKKKVGGVGFDEEAPRQSAAKRDNSLPMMKRRDTFSQRAITRATSVVKAAAKKEAPASFRVVLLLIPFAIILFGIRYRHDQVVGNEDDDHGSSSYSSSYSSSSYSSSSSSSSYSSSSSSSYGGSSYGGDGHVATVFVLAAGIDPKETSLCFTAIIAATIVMDFLIENLNELCEHAGHVYTKLAQALYQELMTLGVIAFVIFLLNAEGFFENKTHLFHNIEYSHIVVFYLGLGLIVQGLALAIVNKDLKSKWKFSAEQTLEEIAEQIEKTKQTFMGEWTVKHGWGEVNRHLDIHLVRITFLDIMNLPSNFAYNEYVNHALDDVTLKIASNNYVTWTVLIAFITATARLHYDGVFMGTDEYGYRNFMICGVMMILLNFTLLAVIAFAETQLLAKLGSTGDLEMEFDLVQAKWPSSEGWQDINALLRDMENKIEQDHEDSLRGNSLTRGGGSIGRNVTRGLTKQLSKLQQTMTFAKQVAKTKPKAVRLSAVGRRIKRLGTRIKSGDKLMALGINPKTYDRFQAYFIVGLRVANLMQAFYISLIFAHWGWYAPSLPLAFLELLPPFVISLLLTPRIVQRFAIVLSIGKPNPTALSQTIVYMEHNEESLHQIAELIINSKADNETIDDVFREWDTNHDGVLTFKELTEAMLANNMHIQSDRIRAMWRKIDIDSSDSISMDEFHRALNPYVRLVELENAANSKMLPDGDDSDSDSGHNSANSSVERGGPAMVPGLLEDKKSGTAI